MKGMVVSKQFYLEAGALWYRELTLLFGSTRHLTSFIHGLRPCFAQAITKVHISRFSLGKTHTSFADLRVCTGLHTLTVEINAIDKSDDKMDFVDDLDSTDLVSLECVQEFAAAKSLRSVTFLPGNEYCAETPKEISQWEKNVDALNVFITSKLEEIRARPGRTALPSAGARIAASFSEFRQSLSGYRFEIATALVVAVAVLQVVFFTLIAKVKA